MPRLLLVLAAAALAAGCAPDHPDAFVYPERVHVRFGDDPAWAQPELDATGWTARPLYPPPDTQGVFWMRMTFDLPASRPPRPLGLYVSLLGASEAYWDGVRIGTVGRVGTAPGEEAAGPIDNLFLVPDSLAGGGTHRLALRASTFLRPPSVEGYLYGIRVGSYEAMARAPARRVLLPLFFLAGFVIIGLYYGVLWALDRRAALGLVALLCLGVAALLVAESWRWAVGYPYSLHLARLLLVTGFTVAVALLLPAVFVVSFRFPRPAWVFGPLLAALALAAFAPGFDTKTLLMVGSAIGASLVVTGWAAWRGRTGARLALGGVGVCLAALALSGYAFLDRYFFPAFGVLTVCLLASLGVQMREQRRQGEAARLAAARLEIELLKKHLLPHFLMNTLTSVMEWIEEHPQTGVRFIEALAAELRLLVDVADQRLIPVGRELALCRAHLAVMGYRRDVRFALDAEGVRPEADVPPALFHTLLENAITHNAYPGGDGGVRTVRFRLREERTPGRRCYTLETPLGGEPPVTGGEGTGLRYVRARLEESFGGRWTLRSEPAGDAWRTVITLPA